MILAVTVLLSAIVISINQVAEIPRGKELLLYALDGVCMEIPQRMMMQTFSGVLFMHWGLDLYYPYRLQRLPGVSASVYNV